LKTPVIHKKVYLLFLLATSFFSCLTAQDLKIFSLMIYEKDSLNSTTFISLSEIYPLSEHPDSLAIPDFSNIEMEAAPNYNYFKLDSNYRKRFFEETKISESDKVFIYDYVDDKLITISVKNLTVIACITPYGASWPYTQYDYMIGLEMNKKLPLNFYKHFSYSIAYIGKESPFIRNQLKSMNWTKMESNDFPSKEMPAYNISYAGNCIAGNVYSSEIDNLHYFVQDLYRLADGFVAVKRLIVIDKKTKNKICEKLFYAGESASFAPLDNQWTGLLIKNKPPIIFGFQYYSFGCPGITFLSNTENDIYIYCDNRH
jgi:hypothetical protein